VRSCEGREVRITSRKWIILNITRTGGVTVRHARNGRIVTLPHDYVRTSVELGYATTVHAAQGVTADTMYGVVTGEEARQQLYTMVTRGRTGNPCTLQWSGTAICTRCSTCSAVG
jgi:UvrD-like helicase C-terminal domain